MLPLCPALILSAATTLAEMELQHPDELRPMEAAGPQRAPATELELFSRIGFWAHYDSLARSSSWPIPLDLSAADLLALARAGRVVALVPRAGDLFLAGNVRRPLEHAGLVSHVLDTHRTPWGATSYECATFEGRLNAIAPCGTRRIDQPAATGRSWRVVGAKRRLITKHGHVLVRWPDLDLRALRYDPTLRSA